ncbi:phage tail sheath family protein, partial [Niallia sp. 03190]|uniref:phage tail sheath family protein n=1 Tax=Niallia sp. 03190 TaxID=3458061 RepID=UPI004043EA7C
MAYQHGINILENDTAFTPPAQNTGGVQIVIGTAPVHLAEDPYAATNKLVLATNDGDAQKKLGYSDEFDKYTLCESMFASFRFKQVGPVVFINVLDPAIHKTTVSDQTISLDKGMATINESGVLLNTVVIKSADGATTYNKNSDYTLNFNTEGKPVLTILSSGAIPSGTNSLKVSFDKVDPSKVTKADIIGGYDSTTGAFKGAELVQKVYPTLSVVPGLVIAPGWSHYPEVAAVLVAKSKKINGCFNAENILDVDSYAVKKYEDVAAWKNDNGYSSEKSLVLWPKVKVGNKILWYSAVLAAGIKELDSDTEDIPAKSPSNKPIAISGTVLADGTEVYLDIAQANHLNGQGIITAINWGGWRVWGNNTAAYPTVVDPKDRFINLRRLMDWWGNSFVVTFFSKVDNLTDTRLIQDIVDSENIRANAYTARGYIAGASIEFREDLNPVSQIINGKITFITKIGGYTPA